MKKIIKRLILFLQIGILFFSDIIFRTFFLLRKDILNDKNRKFVICPTEVSKLNFNLGKALEDSYTVNLNRHNFYDNNYYDFYLGEFNTLLKLLISPVILAYLANISNIFIYIFSSSFLLERKFDFFYLKKIKKKKLINYFVGDDIRSIKKCKEIFKVMDMDTSCNYKVFIKSDLDINSYEREKMYLARLADLYADVVFNNEVDQPSYMEENKKIFPGRAIVDTNDIKFEIKKFDRLDNLVILHAPSSPITKGTQLVRAAIKKLKIEGYQFEYIELINVKNEEVKKFLYKSHIVLNQFYALSPGIFGLEAMAAGNAVLMSADPDLNPYIPQEGKKAWVVTHYWEIYDNLRYLLNNIELIKDYAYNGRKFVEKYHSIEVVRNYILNILKAKNIT